MYVCNDCLAFPMHVQTLQFWSPLMCSLVDGVPEAKETQYSQIQPYSAASAELSVSEPVVQVSVILMSSHQSSH